MENQINQATWGIALKIWWWIMWRSLLCGLILGILLGILQAVIELSFLLFVLLSFVFGTAVNVFFTKKIIGKKFKEFSLVLIKSE